MLRRIHATNFKCLVNFEWELGPARINLMLGPNGSGKTTVFDCLERIRAFATGEAKVDVLFPASTLTQWQDVRTQSFEIEWEREGSVYQYRIEIEHDESRTKQRVSLEHLLFDGRALLRFEGQKGAQLYRDNHSEGPLYPFDWNQSVMASLPSRKDNRKLTWFKAALRRMIVAQIVPPMMEETSIKDATRPLRYFQNFVSWYRWVSQDQGMAFRLQQDLREIIPGFSHFKFESYGPEAKLLKAVFEDKGSGEVTFSFTALSDGQRMLIALYALLHSLRAQPEELDGDKDQPSGLLCLDEPDNFIASREIQPWLTAIEDQLLEAKARLLLISHHPESIDYGLMPSTGETLSVFWFSREAGTHSRVQTLLPEQTGGLKPSELAARGWLGLGGQASEEPTTAEKPPRRKLTKLKP